MRSSDNNSGCLPSQRVLSRRRILQLLGPGAGLAAVAVGLDSFARPALAEPGPTLAADDATSLDIPTTQSMLVTGAVAADRAAATPVTARPGFTVRHLGLSWTGEQAPRVRTLDAAGTDGPWRLTSATSCGDGRDGMASGRSAALLWLSAGAKVVELDLPPSARAVLLNTVDGKPRRQQLRDRDHFRRCGRQIYLTRGRWGADEGLRFGPGGVQLWVPAYYPLQTVTVHHTATAVDAEDPAATVRAIYHFHTVEQGWGDIGYHFLIDPDGRIYEGRYSGDDPLPGFDPQGRPVVAGHVKGYNVGNLGIALLGDFTTAQPSAAARRSLVTLLAMVCATHGLDPTAKVEYVNPISGAKATVAAVSGHRDWPSPTECPGNTFYPYLAQVRAEAAQLMHPLGRPAPAGLVTR